MLFTDVSVAFSGSQDFKHYKKVRYRLTTLGHLVRRARREGYDGLMVRAYAGEGRTGETLCIVTLYG